MAENSEMKKDNTVKKVQPNILVIMTDQQRFDSLGCYGAHWIQTPHLDKLAEEGTLFENCYVNNPICTPSRASMLTGKPLPEHGVTHLHDVLPQDEVLFTERLQNLGYATALFGKLHVSGRIYEEAHRHPHDGFDQYEWCMEASISMDSPLNGYARWLKEKDPEFFNELKTKGRKLTHIPRKYHMTHWAAERTINYIEQHDADMPFFCMMSVFDPHNPYDDYPLEYRDRVDTAAMPMPKHLGDAAAETIRGIRQEQEHGYLGNVQTFSEEDFREMRIGYYASLALLDDEVGEIIAALKKKQLYDNTLIIFVSDHGDMLGDHNLVVKGAYFYEPGVKVPLIMKWPKAYGVSGDAGEAAERSFSGRKLSELVQPHDLAATVLKAAGADDEWIYGEMPDSKDLSRIVYGEEDGHEYAVCSYRNTGICDTGRYFDPPIYATMICDGRYKLNVYHPAAGIDESTSGQLFDLQQDPEEMHNVWDENVQMRSELLEKLAAWMLNRELYFQNRQEISALPQKDQLIVNTLK